MNRRVYIRPLSFVDSPQAADGAAVRLAGGMVFAREFALIVRQAGEVVSRRIVTAGTIAAALAGLPDDLAARGEAQWSALRFAHPPLRLPLKGGGERAIALDRPGVVGILNVTPDSFSDGGRFLDKPEVAAGHAARMIAAGAGIIDIGGESTRPGAAAVREGDEIARVVPMVERLAAAGAAVSVDTRRSAVMAEALAAGAQIVNDVSALRHDPRSIGIVAAAGVPVVLMHAPGPADDLHAGGRYTDVVLDVFDWLEARRDAAVAGGIARGNVILDPGIGFGKSLADNLALLNALPLFHALGQPLLVGVSRKRFIGALSGEAPAHERLGGSLLVAAKALDAGVQLLRVHDAARTAQAARVWRGLRDRALTDFAQIVG